MSGNSTVARQRSAVQQKRTWLDKFRQFCSRCRSSEQEFSQVFKHISVGGGLQNEWGSLESEIIRQDEVRAKEAMLLSKTLMRIREAVGNFVLASRHPSTAVDVNHLRRVLDTAESAILGFTTQQRNRYAILLAETSQLEKDLSMLDYRINMLDERLKARPARPSSAAVRSSASSTRGSQLEQLRKDNRPREILQIERQIEELGGATGRWDPQDHKHFLKLKRQFASNKRMFLERAASEIPGQTLGSVNQHDAWHDEYSSLLVMKKDAIARWRSQKSRREMSDVLAAEAEAVQKQVRPASSISSRREAAARREREERERQLKEWHARQDKEKQEKERQEAERKAAENEKETLRLEHARKQKKKLQEFLVERERLKQEEQALLKAREQERLRLRQENIREDLTRRAVRSLEAGKQRQEKVVALRHGELVKQERLLQLAARSRPKSAMAANRDADRLTQGTASSKKRATTKGDSRNLVGREASVIYHSGRRGVPSWRKQL